MRNSLRKLFRNPGPLSMEVASLLTFPLYYLDIYIDNLIFFVDVDLDNILELGVEAFSFGLVLSHQQLDLLEFDDLTMIFCRNIDGAYCLHDESLFKDG
jgi:hypothetical protein